MGKVYKQGIASPKGFDLVSAEPVDQRTIVEYKTDLYFLAKVYKGLKVQVLEEIDGEELREFKFIGGDSSSPSNWPEVTGGAGTTEPTELPLKFTSFVFKRNTGAPATPTGGTYETPVPIGWSDAVPAGTGPLWMSSAIFEQGSAAAVIWTNPVLTEDTASTDFEYCNLDDVPVGDLVNNLPLPPTEAVGTRTYWHNVPTSDDDFMAIGQKIGGVYPTSWDVIKISGEQGATGAVGNDGRAYKESIVFTRTNLALMETAEVAGGSFSSPVPTSTKIGGNAVAVTWTDGIPVGDEKVWMTKFTFNDVDHVTSSPTYIWTLPGNTTDTSTDDFEFSSSSTLPLDPTTDPASWHDVATVNDIWMAHRSISNGVLGAWGITKIKGETGEQGQGLNIQGRDTITNILALTSPPVELYNIWIANNEELGATVPGTVNDAYLYVGAGNGTGGTAWDNIGGITGTDGLSYLQSFIFKRSVSQPTTPTGGTFASPVPDPIDGWSDSIPTGTDTLWTTSRFFTNPTSATDDWKAPYKATDTVDYDFQYADIQPADATPLTPDLAAGGVWYDTPTTISYWMAKARKVNEVVDDTTWEVLRIKGEKGDTGDAGVPSFLSSVYLKSNDDLSAISVTGGSYVSPIPTSNYLGVYWSDGIPTGDGALWFTQVRFEQTDTGGMVWPSPTKIADSSTVEYQFSSLITQPVGFPVEDSPGINGWYDNASDITDLGQTPRWMAIGSKSNGVWPTAWDIVSIIGEQGVPGESARTFIPSSRFTRCDDYAIGSVTVTGQYLIDDGNGSYAIAGANPTTDNTVGGFSYEFTDGIPDKTETFPNNASRVWMIQTVFNSVDDLGISNPKQWGNPTLLADNNSIDYKYHAGDSPTTPGTKPSDPDVVPAEWYEDVDLVPDGAFWIAQKNWSDGPGAGWVIYQIRGEDGQDGTATTNDPPTVPADLFVRREGFGEKVSWSAATADPVTSIEYYEIEEVGAGLGLFTSTGLTLTLTGLDYDSTIPYEFKVRAVDANGFKSAWSSSYFYTQEAGFSNPYGYNTIASDQCGTIFPHPNGANIYMLIEGGKDLSTSTLIKGWTLNDRSTYYPNSASVFVAAWNGGTQTENMELWVLSNGTISVTGTCTP